MRAKIYSLRFAIGLPREHLVLGLMLVGGLLLLLLLLLLLELPHQAWTRQT